MRRGEIRVVDFGSTRGSEANKRRPAVIVSNDGANTTAVKLGRGVITVIPLTSNTKRLYPFHVLLPANRTGLDRDSKALAEQIRSLDVSRFGPAIGSVPVDTMQEIEEAMRFHLTL